MAATEVDFSSYKDALLVLGTAGVAVPLMHRFRISPVLGFLIVGAILSPRGLGMLSANWQWIDWITVSSPNRVSRLAELGVVFLMFLIGLELSFDRLVTMRRLVFGLGALQVGISTAALAAVCAMMGQPPVTSFVIGAALSLSSTAIVIEVLARQKRLATSVGRTSFSVLLFQDLAVVPILLFISILDPEGEKSVAQNILAALIQAAFALTAILLFARYLLKPLFRLVASTGNEDMFIAVTLFIAVGTSFMTAAAGLSLALGAFVAGLVLAETEFRRAIETTIEPIKSLLLGVFFFSVGLSIDIANLVHNPATILLFLIGQLVIQIPIIYSLVRFYGMSRTVALETAALLATGGEFAFVILGSARNQQLLDFEMSSKLLTATALSMALIPVLQAGARKIAEKIEPPQPLDPKLDVLPVLHVPAKAIVVGYGRVGQQVSDMLEEHEMSYIAVDREPRLVASARHHGKPVYFGDITHTGFLAKCGLETAKAVIITIHTRSEIDQIVAAIRANYPDLIIVARAKDAEHARHLYSLGVTDAVPETIEASLQLSEAALVGIGVPTGLVIASIHERRDQYRAELQGAAERAGTETRALPVRNQKNT